jgi:glycosyltransferase involved in cell wall biosynthesis
VSVIVPVRNGVGFLRELLPMLAAQTLDRPRFEVVIADDGSSDDPGQFETADGHVRVLSGQPLNSYGARNRAVGAARGRVLAFCDADCLPESDWLANGLAALEDADLVAGRIRFIPPERGGAWSVVDMETSKNHERLVKLGLAETANLFVRRGLFMEVGGFDDTIDEHGDFDFVERCVARGARLVYVHDVSVSHPVRTRGRSVLRAHWVYCRGYAERATRRGDKPEGLKLRNWVPVVWTAKARISHGVPLGPDRRWLGENGFTPSTRQAVGSSVITYVVLPYVRNTAQLVGWWASRRSNGPDGTSSAL